MAKKIDLKALRAQIAELAIDKDLKHQLLEAIEERPHYGLVWEESSEEAWDAMQDQLPVFVEDATKRLDAAPAGSPNHVIIEGDNLNALAALSYSHAGKIDVIYIDPPYNTGKDGFTYNDRIVSNEDDYRFSKWLSFMKRRLKLAKHLLSDTGVLFISIDEYSFAQLKLLCDEIFESSSNPDNWNYLSTLIWNKQHSQQQGIFKKYHEYVFVYAKCAKNVSKVLSTADGVIEAGAMKKISTKNPASDFSFPSGVRFEAPDGTRLQGWYGDSEKVEVVEGVLEAEGGKTKYPVTLKAGWTQKKQMQSWFNGYETIDTKGQQVIEFFFNSKGKVKCRKVRGAVTPCSLLPEFGMGSEQTAHLVDILREKDKFSNPKPVDMIELFIEWFCPKDGYVLDFFAGSGTTLESTMKLNQKDGGHRKCILVQGIEKDSNGIDKRICEEVTYERNKRVIQGYTTLKGKQVAGLTNNILRYYKTAFVSRSMNYRNQHILMSSLVDLLCIKNDIYQEQETFGGKRFKKSVLRYFKDEAGQMLVILNENVVSTIVPMIAEVATKQHPLKVYVYADGPYAYDDEFKSVLPVIDLCALPDAFLQALNDKDILPEEKVSEAAIAEFNQNQEIAELDKEAVAEALEDDYDYHAEPESDSELESDNESETDGDTQEQEELILTNEQ